MPFKKVKKNDYVSPSGKHFTKKQVVAYYATNGFKQTSSARNGVSKKPVRKANGRGRR